MENNTIKRLRNRYRLVVMNDDSFEEVITFKLSRISVYISLSIVFIFMVLFTTILLAFTPLKYYIPGYGNKRSKTELQVLKIKTDSLEQAIKNKEQYLDGLKKVLTGTTPTIKDTAILKIDETNDKD
ncbi:MAG: hypothetical protein ACOVMM_12125 [Chitinophagaceae bacterium]